MVKVKYGEVTFEAFLSKNIRSVEYVKNSHYVRLTDCNKSSTKLYAKKSQRVVCADCKWTMFTEQAPDYMKCPICDGELKSIWGKTQVCFIPEEESDFDLNAQPEDKKKDG